MAAQVTCSLFKIFRVARYKRINLEVNLINLSTLLTRDNIYISDNPEGLWQSITSGRLFHTLSDTENICTISSILFVTL